LFIKIVTAKNDSMINATYKKHVPFGRFKNSSLWAQILAQRYNPTK
jgi:hypothetical protein